MKWVRKRGFAPFAMYRIVLGIAVLAWTAGMDRTINLLCGQQTCQKTCRNAVVARRVRDERVAVRNRRCLRAGVAVRPLQSFREDFDRNDAFLLDLAQPKLCCCF